MWQKMSNLVKIKEKVCQLIFFKIAKKCFNYYSIKNLILQRYTF